MNANLPPNDDAHELGSYRSKLERQKHFSEKWASGLLIALWIGVLISPWLSPREKEPTLLPQAIYFAAVIAIAGAWWFVARERSSDAGKATGWDDDWGSRREILLYHLVLLPLAYFILIWGAHTFGFIGFNQVIIFVIAAIGASMVPVKALIPSVAAQLAFCAYGFHFFLGWKPLSLSSILGIASGMAFGCIMFRLLRNESRTARAMSTLVSKLEQAYAKLKDYSMKAEDLAASQERIRIAREIHDTLGHSLTVVNVQLEAAQALLQKNDFPKASEFIEKARQLNRAGLKDVRSSVSSLRNHPIHGKSTSDAIKELVNLSSSTDLKASFETTGQESELPETIRLALYRCAQEALTNCRKHARASEVRVRLAFEPEKELALTVEDNGQGCHQAVDGFGIIGMKERIHLLGGDFAFDSEAGNGTRISISLPL